MLAVSNLAGAALIWTSILRAFIISTTVSLGLVVTASGTGQFRYGDAIREMSFSSAGPG
jgi:hypothetical protein